jgi:hypothetical protein
MIGITYLVAGLGALIAGVAKYLLDSRVQKVAATVGMEVPSPGLTDRAELDELKARVDTHDQQIRDLRVGRFQWGHIVAGPAQARATESAEELQLRRASEAFESAGLIEDR